MAALQPIIIAQGHVIFELTARFHSNEIENIGISNDVGTHLMELGHIPRDASIPDCLENVSVRNFLRARFIENFTDDVATSKFGAPFHISDKTMFVNCPDSTQASNYLVANHPLMIQAHVVMFKKTVLKLHEHLRSSVNKMIQGFPCFDRLDARQAPEKVAAKRKVGTIYFITFIDIYTSLYFNKYSYFIYRLGF